MKKKINKIIICLIGMVYILMILKANTSVAYTYTRPNNNNWRDSIVVWNSSTTSDPKTVTLSDGKKVALVQGGYKTDAIYRSSDGALQCSIVCQPNIYCAQHGTGLSQGSYRASKKFNVDTNQYAGRVLAYILNQNKSTSLSKDWVTPYQVALWKYLYNYKDKDNATDAKRIVNNITINNATSVNEAQDLSQDDLDQADKLITAADEYATNLNVTPTLSVSKENGNIKITTNAKKYEIYLSGKLYKEGENSQFTGTKSISISTALKYTSTGQVTVQVKSLVNQYKASYRILYSYYDEYDKWPAGQQRVIVVTGLETTTKRNASTTVTEALDANVSMQKYITSVSDINGKNQTIVDSRDSYLSRENDMNNNDSDSLGVVYKTKYDRDPSKSKSKKTPYKYDNPVKIDYGDKVTYTIEVSNNGAYPVENVVIRDAFPKIGDNIVVDINSIELNKNGNEMNTSSIPNSGINYLISNSIAAGETKKFTITMKFNSEALKQRTDIIANTAWVEAVYSNVNGSVGLKGKNLKRDYRTADRDYVQMKQYAVSLEKYVVGVNGYRLEDFNDNRSVNTQDGLLLRSEYITNNETMTGFTDSVKNKIQRYGDVNKDGTISENDALFISNMAVGATSIQNCREGSATWYDTISKYKENHPVQVETGDKVTFKIKLTNTGEGNIKVSKIKDTFTNDATKKLSLKSITGNGEGTISGNIITFNNPLEIKAGESTFIEVTFEVTTENLNSEHSLNNTAEITEMKNRNNQSILSWDNDGTNNNKDTDYLKVLKQYAVGLNKFITKVNNADLITNTDNLLYNYNSTDRSGLSKTDKSTDANKVRVEPGDTVIYTLRLTNTSPTDGGHSAIKVSKIEDIPQKINNNCYLDYDSSYEIKENGGGTVAKNGNKLTITFSEPEEIYPGKNLDITIRFKVVVKDSATATYQTLENTATVTEIKNRNNITVNDVDGTGNNSNSDYIKTKIYAVDLKKFVSKVEYTGKTNSETLVTKTDDPGYNCANKERENYSGQDKEKDPVRVEPGDLVTFTIRLINTGINADGKADYKNYGAIKVKQITDTIPNYCNYEGNIIGNGGGTVSGDKINFNNAQLINPGAFIDIEVTFKVNVPLEQTGTQQTMVNKAYVNNIIYNRHHEVNDSDNKRNYDYDYIKTKIYAVGIEKYVTGVGTKDNANSLVTDENKTNENKSNYNCAKSDRSGHPQYNKNEYDKSTDDNRVRVEPGDYVTFTIEVKNTGTDYVNYGKISTTTISESFTKNANCKLVYDSTSAQKDNESDKIKFSPEGGIEPGKAATFTIKFRVEVTGDLTGTQQNLENTATISDKDVITNKNTVEVKDSDRDKNNTDSDYLRTKIYKVALEKYVTQVNDNALSKDAGANYNVKSLSERNGNPIYDSTNKENDIVNLETGDTVTFAIIVKNIGDNYINYGTIKTLEITDESSTKLQYNKVCQGARYNNGTITGVPSIAVGNEATIYLGYTVTLDPTKTKEKIDLVNTATINSNTIKNKHDVLVKEDKNSRQDEDNTDSDYLRTKVYAVSLEKYVSKVVDKSGNDITDKIKMGPQKEGMDRPREGYAEHNYNNSETTEENCDKTKRRNPVTTVTGDTITYTIKLKNDSEAKTGIDTTKDSNNDKNSYNTAIEIGNVIDYLPNGMQYDGTEYTNDNYKVTYDFKTSNGQTLSSGRLLYPGDTAIVTITATVTEDKMSLNILKNVAEINEDSLTNKNGSKVYDTTENNNRDADYIQLNYKHDDIDPDPGDDDNIFFAGTVWNDMALNKTGDKYNGEINTEERKLEGIKVFLYRDEYGLVADTTTNNEGEYSFGDNDLQSQENYEKYFKKFANDDMSKRYIKGPKKSKDDNSWAGYYSYYILFEYDGITYTSTPDGNSCANIFKDDESYKVDSNASEDRGKATQKRVKFNNNIQTMVDNKEIQYYQKNDDGYIPESRYIYEASKMSIQSSTDLIELSEFINNGTDKYLERSKYIGLGLRGRDIFDLELTSDVSRVEVTVNNIVGNYEYTNKVNVRKEDVNSNYLSDMANSYTSSLEKGAQYVQTAKNGDENDSQVVRKTDLDKSLTNTNGTEYSDGNLLNSIYVIYKISVNNASPTPGYATQIVDYYDKKYQLEGVYTDEKCNSDSKYTKYINYSDESTSDYNYVIVKDLKEIYNIYVKLQLTDAKEVLTEYAWDEGMATYNMAEIYQYETGINKEKGQTEYTRGLIDKDSAPGSVATETVRLTEGTSDRTTVQYYFTEHDKLNKLKYEDDTYATPTLYFTTDSSIRVIEGNVFEDLTDVVPESAQESTLQRKRSGDGVWQKDTEPAIDGITVQLYEGDILRYETTTQYDSTTKTGGYYKFAGFLPGNYTLKYYYGKSDETFYINPDKNEKSYNGEDFQATNNNTAITYTYNGKKYTIKSSEKCLDTTENTWYSNNENGVSVANDETTRRKEVINNVCNYTDYKMQVLNNVRDGKNKDNAKEYDYTERKYIKPDTIKNETWMSATTKNMLFSVEQTSKHVVSNKFGTYAITKMNFGIAEVPISTIDLQKHVNQFEIKDSTGKNTIAKATVEEDQSTIKINPSKITDVRKQTNVKKALESAEINYNDTDVKINGANEEIELTVKAGKNVAEAVETLRKEMTKYSLGSIIKIIPKWKVEGNVLTGVKSTSTVLDVSIEDAKLQGAKLQVTYDISATIYAEKNYNKDTDLVPTIDGLIDCIDNNLSYNDSENTGNHWKVVKTDSVKYGESGRGISEMTKYTTILNAETGNGLLLKNIGTGTAKITLERVLTSTDSTISNIITSSIEAFEYENTVQITKINYDNMTDEGITYKDRVRTPDRYIVLPGVGHYSATSETIAIHPPTGDTSTHTMYYIIGAAGLAVLAIGAFGIKKFVLKGKSTKK